MHIQNGMTFCKGIDNRKEWAEVVAWNNHRGKKNLYKGIRLCNVSGVLFGLL